MNTPSYKHTVAGINYCVSDCYSYDNLWTINKAGSECILITTCITSDALSNDNKNCLSACPDGNHLL